MMREQNGNYHVIPVLFRCFVIKAIYYVIYVILFMLFMVKILLFSFINRFFECKFIAVLYTLYFSKCSMYFVL